MKNNKWMIPLLGTILMGLSTWVLITLVELQSLVAMLQQEIFLKAWIKLLDVFMRTSWIKNSLMDK